MSKKTKTAIAAPDPEPTPRKGRQPDALADVPDARRVAVEVREPRDHVQDAVRPGGVVAGHAPTSPLTT